MAQTINCSQLSPLSSLLSFLLIPWHQDMLLVSESKKMKAEMGTVGIKYHQHNTKANAKLSLYLPLPEGVVARDPRHLTKWTKKHASTHLW